MTVSNFSKVRRIPTDVATKKSAPTTTNFAKGIFTYKPNDTMDYDEAYLVQNGRFDRIGEYETRHGLALINEPIGKSSAFSNLAGGYDMAPASEITYTVPAPSVPTPSWPVYSIKVYAAADSLNDFGVLQLLAYDENDELLGVSCAQINSTTPALTEFVFTFPFQFQVLTLKFATQGLGGQKFNVGVIPQTTTLMFDFFTATPGRVIGLFEANIDGVTSVLFAFRESGSGDVTLYRMAANHTVTTIRQLPAGVTAVRFSQNLNQIRYVDGVEGPRLIDPTDWSDSAIPTEDLETDVDLEIKTSNILAGTQDNLIYFDAETDTQAVWTYPYGYQFAHEAEFETSATLNKWVDDETVVTTTIQLSTITAISDAYPLSDMKLGDWIMDQSDTYGTITAIAGDDITVTAQSHVAYSLNSYDKFDRDFRQNFPAIKTGDPLTAMFNLGGVVYFLTRRNKYFMYSQTADVWTQQASSAQHGTFTQESCVCDLNYAYYANDDGVYIFDGSSEASITQNTIQNTYDLIAGKESIVLELYGNRLYVFYSSQGNGINDSCLVYNVNLKLWESFDTGLPVASSIGRQTASNRFICGSSTFGQLLSYENPNNAYADICAPIAFDVETAYLHFGTPSQLHRITKWRPEFATVPGHYTIKCGYALDFTDDVKYAFSIDLHDQTILNEHIVWDEPRSYGQPVEPTKLTTIPQVNGQFRRCQIRYQHHAAFEPVNFKSHTLCVETQRIR